MIGNDRARRPRNGRETAGIYNNRVATMKTLEHGNTISPRNLTQYQSRVAASTKFEPFAGSGFRASKETVTNEVAWLGKKKETTFTMNAVSFDG